MTWNDALAAWHRVDGAVWFGVAGYLFWSRRDARRHLTRAAQIVREQEATIRALIAAARTCGIVLTDPRRGSDDDDERRLH